MTNHTTKVVTMPSRERQKSLVKKVHHRFKVEKKKKGINKGKLNKKVNFQMNIITISLIRQRENLGKIDMQELQENTGTKMEQISKVY